MQTQNTDRPLRRMPEGARFNQFQLDSMRNLYERIERVDPESETVAKIRDTVAAFSDEAIRQVAGAKIKWLSYFARRAAEERNLDLQPMRNLPVRRISIRCKDHPEWGTWGVFEDRGGHYEIYGRTGGRMLDKSEAEQFWEIVH